MSLEALTATLNLTMDNRAAKLVALSLADHHNPSSGTCWPSVETIMRHSSASRATVFRCLGWLEDNGFIKRKARFDEGHRGRQTSSEYELLYLGKGACKQSQNETPKRRRKPKNATPRGRTNETGEGRTGETGEGLNHETPMNRKKEPEEGTVTEFFATSEKKKTHPLLIHCPKTRFRAFRTASALRTVLRFYRRKRGRLRFQPNPHLPSA